MRRRWIVCATGGLFAVAVVLLLLAYFLPFGKIVFTDADASLYTLLLRRKIDIAERIPSRKLLISGGSSSLEGFHAEAIEQSLGIPCVNFAVGAGAGYDLILYETAKRLHPGDMVLVAPEFDVYLADQPSITPPTALTSYMLGSDFFRTLSVPDLSRYIWLLPFPQLAQFAFSGKDGAETAQSIDLDHILTTHGDVIYSDPPETYREALKKNLSLIKDLYPPLLYDFQGVSDLRKRRFDQVVTSFIVHCRQRNIDVLFTYPNSYRSDALDPEKMTLLGAAIKAYYEEKGVPFLGAFEDSRFPLDCLNDTFYHLNGQGRRVRTARLIEDLRPFVPAVGGIASTVSGLGNGFPKRRPLFFQASSPPSADVASRFRLAGP
ncbi:hypothetical protein DFW101_0943 [Solidesulfovibrio carbinoliphilus subsp. oakridgensis]|uniref:Uncharacterized protein n=1 Tax=Solidesulfovibrio carbinoliphilus subsp. oakridgensis TaxID=694327 RepID=G7Q489_9BACT|nr:hypothetical protein [Solidesulfovibrio carbinoliphilus]EHJ46957.1 hypothetical protein DFW101_0943 [Solidesulfovibrio carbinoliphilus subsp. oakridgensis]